MSIVYARVYINMSTSPSLDANTSIFQTDWEAFIRQIVQYILREQSPAQVLVIRKKLYELLAHCIEPTTIIKVSYDCSCPLTMP